MQSTFLFALTLANSAAGFLLQVLIAKRFGVGATSDAYFRAMAAPLFCFGLFLSQSIFRAVPALMLRAARGSHEWMAAARSYYLTAVALGVGLATVGALFWPPGLLSMSAEGGNGQTAALGVTCWIFGAAQFPLIAMVALLQSRYRYSLALMAQGLPQAAACLSLWLVPQLGIVVVPATQAFFSAGVAAMGAIFMLRKRSGAVAGDGGAAGFGLRIVMESPYTVATLACFSIYTVIDSKLLPIFGSGFLTSASFCQRIVIGLGQLMIAAPMTLITKDLVKAVNERDPLGFKSCLLAALTRVLVHSSLLAVALYFSADWVMRVLLTSRSAAGYDTAMAARTLRCMLPGMVLMLGTNILVRSALAIPALVRRTWWLGLVWGLAYAICIALISSPGFNGSGCAYSLSWALVFSLLAYYLKRAAPAHITARAS